MPGSTDEPWHLRKYALCFCLEKRCASAWRSAPACDIAHAILGSKSDSRQSSTHAVHQGASTAVPLPTQGGAPHSTRSSTRLVSLDAQPWSCCKGMRMEGRGNPLHDFGSYRRCPTSNPLTPIQQILLSAAGQRGAVPCQTRLRLCCCMRSVAMLCQMSFAIQAWGCAT